MRNKFLSHKYRVLYTDSASSLFLGGFWALLSQIWSKIAEILIRSSSLANKNIVWKNLKDSKFYRKETDLTFARLVHLWPPVFSWKISAIGLTKCVKIKALSPLLFPGKTRLLLAIFGILLSENRVGSQIKGLESKCDKIL